MRIVLNECRLQKRAEVGGALVGRGHFNVHVTGFDVIGQRTQACLLSFTTIIIDDFASGERFLSACS